MVESDGMSKPVRGNNMISALGSGEITSPRRDLTCDVSLL